MLIISDRKSASGTRQYVAKQERIEGKDANPFLFLGRLAEKYGIAGIADREIFNFLVGNRMPDGKEKLTPRDGANRLVCKDLNFNCPKGLSLAYNFSPGGEKIKEAVVESIQEALEAVAEPLAEVRYHPKGEKRTVNLRTGQVLVGLDIHESNRSGEPHLHGHAYLLNVSEHGGKRYALKSTEIHKAAKKIETDFHKRLRAKVDALGYRTKTKGPFWELADISNSTIRKFSERRNAIEQLYSTVQKVTPGLRKAAGIMTRKPKDEIINLDALRKDWVGRLTPNETSVFRNLQSKPKVHRMLKKRRAYVAGLRFREQNTHPKERDRGLER